MTTPSQPCREIWVTEGVRKCYMVAGFGLHVVGLYGCWLRDHDAKALLAQGVDHVILALDADKHTNPQVAAAERSNIKRLLEAGTWRVSTAEWDIANGKGLDDLLKNGYLPRIVSVRPGPDGPTKDSLGVDPGPTPAHTGKEAAALTKRRNDQWYYARGNGGELSPITTSSGQLADRSARSERINVIDPDEGLSKTDLALLIRMVEGSDSKTVQRVKQCGWNAKLNCKAHPDEHGEQGKTKTTCKLGAHTECPTDTTAAIRQTILPDLEGDAGYRSAWLHFPIDMGPQTDWQDRLKQVAADVTAWASKASKRSKYKGLMLDRALAFWLDPVNSMGQLRLLLQEKTPGQADELIAEAMDRFGALVVGDLTSQSGEWAILQAMEDSASTLLGIGRDQTDELFDAWWYATKRVKLFQRYAGLYKALKERVKEPLPMCSVCGGDLILVPIPPEPSLTAIDEWDEQSYEHATSPPGIQERQEVMAW